MIDLIPFVGVLAGVAGYFITSKVFASRTAITQQLAEENPIIVSVDSDHCLSRCRTSKRKDVNEEDVIAAVLGVLVVVGVQALLSKKEPNLSDILQGVSDQLQSTIEVEDTNIKS